MPIEHEWFHWSLGSGDVLLYYLSNRSYMEIWTRNFLAAVSFCSLTWSDITCHKPWHKINLSLASFPELTWHKNDIRSTYAVNGVLRSFPRQDKQRAKRESLISRNYRSFFSVPSRALLNIIWWLIIFAEEIVFVKWNAENNKTIFLLCSAIRKCFLSISQPPRYSVFYRKPYLHICFIQLEPRKWENFNLFSLSRWEKFIDLLRNLCTSLTLDWIPTSTEKLSWLKIKRSWSWVNRQNYQKPKSSR